MEPGEYLALVADRGERFDELADRLELELVAAGRGIVVLTVDVDSPRRSPPARSRKRSTR